MNQKEHEHLPRQKTWQTNAIHLLVGGLMGAFIGYVYVAISNWLATWFANICH